MRFILGEFSTGTTGSAGTASTSRDIDANYSVPVDVASLSPSKITGTVNCGRRGQCRVNRSKELRFLSPLSPLSPLDIAGFEITNRTKYEIVMALWQQLKTGNIVPEVDEDVTMGLYTEINATAGKGVINNAIQQISKMWDEVEHSGGAIAWEWILRKSHHGARIQKAEERVDTIGSRGDLAVLVSACKAWVAAWRDGIEAWKKIKTTAKS